MKTYAVENVMTDELVFCLVQMTKLEHDSSSGTALQVERALQQIQEKCESTEVMLTLDGINT